MTILSTIFVKSTKKPLLGLFFLCTREESNFNYKIRNLVSYPLNDECNAEKEGFEPSGQFYPPNTLAVCPFRPLRHLSP